MRFTIALSLVFIALVLVGKLLQLSGPLDAAPSGDAPSDPAVADDSSQGASVDQIIQKVVPKGSPAPEIVSAVWFNSPPLATQDLRGKVVVVEFWTYG